MEHMFNRVIVLLNSVEKMEVLLHKGVTFAKEHKALLEVLYVHEESWFDIPDLFLKEEQRESDRQAIDTKKIKQEIEKHLEILSPDETYATLVFLDDTVDRLLSHAKEVETTLVITEYHEKLATVLLSKTAYAFWFIKRQQARYKKMILAIDLKDNVSSCIEMAQHFFPDTALTLVHDYRYMLDVLSVREDYFNLVPMSNEIDAQLGSKLQVQQKSLLERYANKYKIESYFMEGEGLLDEDLAEYIKDEKFNLTILYRNNEELFFSPTLIVKLMNALSTDFLICKP